ncbi:hypothetical protein GLOIN_2v1653024 [Rhizophagus clarus]|uniref:Uncharacterized protein n=1 Tax=Rhizophagus clarus TaxID=94130 RepID=A0A8H3KZJ3_9GLOM|nr:hypothetical protein GLOIN_2v1653024 [Rhizophagus clarus]
MIIDKLDDQPVPQPAAVSIITTNVTEKKKLKYSTVQHVVMPNNNVDDSQSGQVRTIMVYDIPAIWSHQKILESLKNGRLKDRKVREQFQMFFDLHVDISDELILKLVYNEDNLIVDYHKAKACKTYKKSKNSKKKSTSEKVISRSPIPPKKKKKISESPKKDKTKEKKEKKKDWNKTKSHKGRKKKLQSLIKTPY